VFPFNKFRGVDTILGPEMRSTGEVMGISTSYGQAFAKAQLAAGQRLPRKGTVFLSVNDRDKKHWARLEKNFRHWVFGCLPPGEPLLRWETAGIEAEPVFKVNEGRPNIVDLVKTGKIDLVITLPLGASRSTTKNQFGAQQFVTTFLASLRLPQPMQPRVDSRAARAGTEVAALQDCTVDGPLPRACPQEIKS